MYNLPYLSRLGAGDNNNNNNDGAVIVTSCCPGLAKTDLGRQYADSWWMRLLLWVVFSLVGRTPEQGARTLVSAAVLGQEGKAGFWKNDTFLESSPLLKGEEGRKGLSFGVGISFL